MSSTQQKIIEYIKSHQEVSPDVLSEEFQISRQMLHRYLARLLETGQIVKSGKPPKVIYRYLELPRRQDGAMQLSQSKPKRKGAWGDALDPRVKKAITEYEKGDYLTINPGDSIEDFEKNLGL